MDEALSQTIEAANSRLAELLLEARAALRGNASSRLRTFGN
jgi:hypothetical protein